MNKNSDYILLIVDDNPKNLQLLGSILKEDEFKVEFATNGAEALDWLDEQDFDLVLLDIMMPGMDGYETCKKIRENNKNDDMPVIFLTAKTAKESIVKGFESGAQDYISKPFDKSELLARVSTHLELRTSKIKLKEVNSWLEKKVAERTAQLEKANIELSKLDEAKTEFLNLIGHEIRTPLNGIIGPMQLIKSDENNKEMKLMLKLMEASVGRLEKFALEALLITNLRTGKHKLNTTLIDLGVLFDDLKVRMKDALASSSTNMVSGISEQVYVNGDRELLEICFEELIAQSIRFIEKEGDLLIGIVEKNESVAIHISDKRIKLSDDFLDSMDKLFEPAGEYADSNIGIAMVLANLILQAHKGSITMINSEVNGATLVVNLPR